ncbi:MAG TPA: arginine--tRNA ligase [Verrucomicrobiae bacterium]|nr:arginine--tRNA ligase [Verrucomicrobiae bacterium]
MLHLELERRLRAAVAAVLPDADAAAVQVRPCPDPKFGDYQSNSLMALAKARRLNPRQLATDVLAKLDVAEMCEKVEIAGAGFLNFRLKPEAIAQALTGAARGEHLFFQKAAPPRTFVIDFSSPNVAKPMHVGHIRSTVLGDCLARLLRLLGHRVVTDNHIGDWGTQFGMLLAGWKQHLNRAALDADPFAEMERLYKKVAADCQANPAALEAARAELVKLQSGDADSLAIWREMQRLSLAQFDKLYSRLGVQFDHTLGESFYNPRLQAVVDDLRAKGIATESDGAVCVFSDGSAPPKDDPFLVQREGQWIANPQLIQKSDGAFNYATTDLATLAYRLETWHPDEILYVTDGRQQLHFRQLFATFRRWQPAARVKLSHVWFGSILGEDGRPFKTRSGDTVKLAELLDEAQERALAVVKAKQLERSEADRVPERLWPEIARVVGLGAVKYADLLPNRQSDYTFNWDKMLALSGNTAPYLQYAYARVRSIFRKAGDSSRRREEADTSLPAAVPPVPPPHVGGYEGAMLALAAPEEIVLAKQLLNFGLVLEAVAEEWRPNFLCNYLYELAGHFARFYEACPVLKAEGAQRATRLVLCDLSGRVLKQGLEVLGIEVLEQM